MHSGYLNSLYLGMHRLMAMLAMAASLLWAPSASALVVLQYHHVSDDTPSATSISPTNFADHMAHLKASGFRVIGLPELLALVQARQPLPDRTVLITFDDAYVSVLEVAHPILKANGWPYVIFASTEAVDHGQRHVMSWDQLRQLAREGAAVANHGHQHTHLVRRPTDVDPAQWAAQVKSDLLSAQARLKEELKQTWPVLAFPYGEYDASLVNLMQTWGWLAFGQQSGAAALRDLPVLPRFPFGGRYVKIDDFAQKLQALPLPLAGVELADEAGHSLADGVLPLGVRQPQLSLTFNKERLAQTVNCYVSGQGLAEVLDGAGAERTFQAKRPLPPGRSRYNCTAPSGERGRFYWFSQAFLRPTDDGHWPREP